MEDWALIGRLAAEGVPKARIAERLGISRTTVVKAVHSASPPRYERRSKPTSFTSFEGRVRALLEDDPERAAVVIAERVGWTRSITWFRANVKQLRPEHRKIDPADRLVGERGDGAVAGDQDLDVPGGLTQPVERRLIGAHLIGAPSRSGGLGRTRGPSSKRRSVLDCGDA